jgi:hypothetical protein
MSPSSRRGNRLACPVSSLGWPRYAMAVTRRRPVQVERQADGQQCSRAGQACE